MDVKGGVVPWVRKKKNRLAGFEDKVLRRIFVSKTEAATRGWRKLHDDELHNLCSSWSNIMMIRLNQLA